MNVVLFGATGMIGRGVLTECLDDARVDNVLVIGRSPCGITHSKLREVIRSDLSSYPDASELLGGHHACFWCLGVSSWRMSEAIYHRITYELTIAAARALAALNPGMTFCFVSGEGTDSTERGRSMWARVKGKTENELFRLPLNVFVFRPGFVQPMKGIRPRSYRLLYGALGPLYPLLHRFFPTHVTTTENVGKAMVRVACLGRDRRVLENADINTLAEASA